MPRTSDGQSAPMSPNHEEPERSQPSEWWRWPLLPFAAVLGAVLGAMLFGMVQWFGMKMQGGYSEDGWMYRYVMPVLISGAFGWLYAWIACEVAPRGKVIAGVVMTTILFLLAAGSVMLAWVTSGYGIGDTIQATIGCVVSLVAAIVALIQAHEKHS
jgi:hypothetical protein